MPDRREGTPRVGLMVIGGTIDALEIEGSRRQPGMLASARIATDEIVATVERLATLPKLDILPGPQRLSHELENGDWIDIAQRIQEVLDGETVDAVVVTHGTNNLEELAYFLSLTVHSEKPVVITGAMLPWNSAGADGCWNLINAIRVAASPASWRRGILVAFGRDVFEPRSLTKVSTHALSAFAAPGAGPIGRFDGEGGVRYNRPPQQRFSGPPVIVLAEALKMPRVDIVVSYVGADGTIIESCVASGAAGLVTAAGGGGVVTPREHAALLKAVAGGVIVCQASRVSGGVAQLTNERSDNGFVAAGDLSPWKARILLMLALTQSRDVNRIREFFNAY